MRLSIMFRKQKELSTKCKNLAEIDVIEIKTLIGFCDGQGREKKGELKVTPIIRKSLKAHVEKMSTFRLSMMLMKTSELYRSLHYVDENKRSYHPTANPEALRWLAPPRGLAATARSKPFTQSPLLPSSLSPGRGKRGREVGVRGLAEIMKIRLVLIPGTVKLRLLLRQSRGIFQRIRTLPRNVAGATVAANDVILKLQG